MLSGARANVLPEAHRAISSVHFVVLFSLLSEKDDIYNTQ